MHQVDSHNKHGERLLSDSDPFRHHPDLRGKIKPAADSYFRDLDLAVIDAHRAKAGLPDGWRTPCELREAARREWLEGHWDQDLWVFGYGSLMWDPAIEFAEVRHAQCRGYQRSFCLVDQGGRGSADCPGLMLAIDEGTNCEGLAFRIDAAKLDHETFVLFRREMIAGSYRPTWLSLDTAQGPIEALGFVANRENERIKPDIPLNEQAEMISKACGLLGSNFDYLSNTRTSLELLEIRDDYISGLYAAATSLRTSAS